MNITFDAAKDAANIAKHGVSLVDAERLNRDWLYCRPDARRDYHELREIGIAPLVDRVHCVVFAQQGEVFHIISLRRANAREVNEYDEALQEFRIHHPHA